MKLFVMPRKPWIFRAPAKVHQRHGALLPRLKPHSGAGRDVQPHAVGRRAVKPKGGIGLGKMVVGPPRMGRSAVLLTTSVAVRRPVLIAWFVPSVMISPGVVGQGAFKCLRALGCIRYVPGLFLNQMMLRSRCLLPV